MNDGEGATNVSRATLGDCTRTSMLSSPSAVTPELPPGPHLNVEAIHLGDTNFHPYLDTCISMDLDSPPILDPLENEEDSFLPVPQHASLHASLCALSYRAPTRSPSPKPPTGRKPLLAHVDGGSQATTTDQKHLIWNLRPLPENHKAPKLQVADNTAHYPQGIGYLTIPTQGCHQSLMVETYYTPTLPATILSPARVGKQKGYSGYSIVASFDNSASALKLHHPTVTVKDLLVPLSNRGGLLYATVLPPSDSETPETNHESKCYQEKDASDVYQMSRLTQEQLRVLWHHRLGHIHSRRVANMHKFADGIPKLPEANELQTCPICVRAKLHKAAKSKKDSRHATVCGQGISIDFGFMVQTSADKERKNTLTGLNGETAYCLIADHHSGTLYGATLRSKAPPVEYISQWIAIHGKGIETPGKYVRMDLGGELGRSTEIKNLFRNSGYAIEPTGADSSHQNGPGERPHRTIGDGVRALLGGANLPPKFWPYAFHHFLRLYNVTNHGVKEKTPHEICTGQRPNLQHLKTFGCRVYSLANNPNKNFRDKAVSDVRIGIFLGFGKTMKTALVYDSNTGRIRESQHVAFDESFNGEKERPPNAVLLDLTGEEEKAEVPKTIEAPIIAKTQPELDKMEVSAEAFTMKEEVRLKYHADSKEPLGLSFSKCSHMMRMFISDVHVSARAQGVTARHLRKNYLGAYIISIAGQPVMTSEELEKVMNELAVDRPEEVAIVLAPERKDLIDKRHAHAHGQINALYSASVINGIINEGRGSEDVQKQAASRPLEVPDMKVAQLLCHHSPEENEGLNFTGTEENTLMNLVYRVNQLHNEHMTEEEKELRAFTRRNLMRLSNWKEAWDPAFDDQLNNHFKAGALGIPVERPIHTPEKPVNILRLQWVNVVKDSGKRKARACIDGSLRAAPWLRDMVSTYASCIEAPCMRLFFALCAANNLTVITADTTNAFQQSPPPSVPCFVEIDDAYESWYQKRFPDAPPLDRKRMVVPVGRALQGHPEAGKLWEKMIVGILKKELGFVSTSHERNLYRGEIDGNMVLVCRQVDDFAIGCKVTASSEKLVELINKRVTTTSEGMGKKTEWGLHLKYNGMDVYQTADYIHVACPTYIEKMLQTHGWDTEPKMSHHPIPMTDDVAKKLMTMEKGPAEKTPAHRAIESSMGFAYRSLLGELTYPFVLCRADIGFAATFLSRFSTAPCEEHYKALKAIARYLRATKRWGITYWQPGRNLSFPMVPAPPPSLIEDDVISKFPRLNPRELVAFSDAAHATDVSTRKSVTGYIFMYAGGAVAYKSKLQATVATSSTEAEFIASVHTAKTAKYLRSVLSELGFAEKKPTQVYIDNSAAIDMINENKPTQRSRHIDIQLFAIQEWRENEELTVVHIPGILNPADVLTKPLGPTLFHRHVTRMLGQLHDPWSTSGTA